MLGRLGLSLRQCLWSVDQLQAWSPESGSIDMIYKTDWEPPQGAGQAPHSVPQPVHTSPAPSHGDPRVGQVPPLCSQLSPVVNWGPGALPSLNLLASSPQPARPLPPHSGPPPEPHEGWAGGWAGLVAHLAPSCHSQMETRAPSPRPSVHSLVEPPVCAAAPRSSPPSSLQTAWLDCGCEFPLGGRGRSFCC